MIALNDAIADGRDVSWIWDVDFEPLLEGLERVIVTGARAAELALRFKYAGLEASAIEVEPDLERGARPRARATPAGGELVVLPTYTAMLALRQIVAERGHVRPYWERPREDRRRAPLPGLPEHLRRPRQHRRPRAARRLARARARGPARLGRRTRSSPASTTSSTSAAARTASRRSWRPTSRARRPRFEAVAGGAAVLAVCGGYQLLGRFYRDRAR